MPLWSLGLDLSAFRNRYVDGMVDLGTIFLGITFSWLDWVSMAVS